jgi:hypothetical protein
MARVTLAVLVVVVAAAGVAGGLVYTWVLDPVEYYDTSPDSLHIQDKLLYLALVGDLYACEQDLALAEARLAELGLEPDGPALADLIDQALDSGGRPEDVRHLAQLARDLGASGGVLLVFGAEPTSQPELTSSPEPTQVSTALPDTSQPPAPSVTPAPSFQIVDQTALCGGSGQPGRIMVWVEDVDGNGLAGVEIVVSWAAGQDRFFTGLWPEMGAGYADFEMKARTEYDVSLADYRGDVAERLSSDLSAGICPTDTIALDWRLVFQQAQ